ncbi:unnamed protein product [Prorocentrum cordatum]|nr:unnamed protein product [Polarella glacialis]
MTPSASGFARRAAVRRLLALNGLAAVSLSLSGCGCPEYDCCAENGGSGHCDASSRDCCTTCAADNRVDTGGDCVACERGTYSVIGAVRDDGESACSACADLTTETVCSGMTGCSFDASGTPSCKEKTCADADSYSLCENKLSSTCQWDHTAAVCKAAS